MTTTQATKVNRAWFIKRVVLPAIVLIVIGVWGLVDATIIYPRSGRLDASLKLKQHLDVAEESRRLTRANLKIDNPAAELRALVAKDAAGDLLPLEKTRLAWLRSLKTVWDINDESVWVADVKRPLVSKTGDEVYAGVGGVSDVKQETVSLYYKPRTAEGYVVASDKAHQPVGVEQVGKYLKDYWATAKTPSPLAAYDLPLQWVFTVGGFAGALYLVALYLRVASKRFHFEPETRTLITPSGERFAAAELREVDKRKWHKFYVTLHANDNRAVTLDLYRHEPLEEWVLDMEKAAFPESQPAETAADDAEAGDDELAVPADAGRVAAMTYGGHMDGVFCVFLFNADEIRSAGQSPAAYAQGEVLKALGVALRDEGGWRQWLTAACGSLRGRAAKTALDFLAEREATFKAALSRHEPAVADAIAAGAEPAGEWYAVVVGRLSEQTAQRACDVLLDPPPNGFAGFGALRAHPPTIERLQEPLGLEPGMEIKGDTLVGRWDASGEDIETAGLKLTAGEGANA